MFTLLKETLIQGVRDLRKVRTLQIRCYAKAVLSYLLIYVKKIMHYVLSPVEKNQKTIFLFLDEKKQKSAARI